MKTIKYYSVVKWKIGERKALEHLRNKSNNFTPIIELVTDEGAAAFFASLAPVHTGSILLDTIHCGYEHISILKSYITYAQNNGIDAMPVVYAEDIDYLSEILQIAPKAAIKIPVPENFDSELPNASLISELNNSCSPSQITLILDAGQVLERDAANRIYRDYKNILQNQILKSFVFEKIIICLTSFPEKLTVPPAGENCQLVRYDFRIFKQLYKTFSPSLTLAYGDYGVTKFTDSEIDFSLLKNGILPKVKYTTFDHYIVLKGKKNNLTKKYSRSYTDISKEIISSDYYLGKDYSFGDLDIYKRATGELGPGNSTQWVTINANHHISVVLEQLSNPAGF